MSHLQELLWSDTAVRIGWALLHSVWQLSALAAAFLLLSFALRRRTPVLRYTAGCVTMAAMTLAPVLTFVSIPSSARQPRAEPAASEVTPGGVGQAGSPRMMQPVSPELFVSGDAQAWTATVRPANPPTNGFAPAITPLLPWLAAGWAIGAVAVAFWNLGGWVALQRLRRFHTAPPAADTRRRFETLRAQLSVSKPVQLCCSAVIVVPSVIGWLRPVILLPAAAAASLTPRQLEALLAHELAHVLRGDYLVNVCQTVIETLLFYHPAVWWVSGRIRFERELCCDDIAANLSGDRVEYAEALAAMERLCADVPAGAGLALAADGGRRRTLLPRVRRLLAPASEPDPIGRRPAAASLLVVTLLAAAVLTTATAWMRGADDAEPDAAASDARGEASPPTEVKLDEKTIRALIEQLGDDSLKKRAEAQKKLVAAGKAALPLLRNAATENSDAEIRESAKVVTRMISAAPGPDNWKPGSSVFDLAYSKDGKTLAVACQDRTVRVFDANTGALRQTLNGHTNNVYCALFATGDETLVSCSGVWRNPGREGEIIVWDLASGQARHTMKSQQGGFAWVVYAPDEKHLYTCGDDGTIRKWDTGKQTEVLSANGGAPIRRLMFTPDGKQLASVGYNGTVRFWDPDTLKEVRQFMAHPSGVCSLAFSPDGKFLITCSRAGAPPVPAEIKVWDMATLAEKRTIKGHKSRVLSLAVSPDSKLLAVGGGEHAEYGEVMVFDLESGAVRANLPDHHEWVEAVLFSPDGSRLATAGGFGPESRGEVRVWDVKGLFVKGE